MNQNSHDHLSEQDKSLLLSENFSLTLATDYPIYSAETEIFVLDYETPYFFNNQRYFFPFELNHFFVTGKNYFQYFIDDNDYPIVINVNHVDLPNAKQYYQQELEFETGWLDGKQKTYLSRTQHALCAIDKSYSSTRHEDSEILLKNSLSIKAQRDISNNELAIISPQHYKYSPRNSYYLLFNIALFIVFFIGVMMFFKQLTYQDIIFSTLFCATMLLLMMLGRRFWKKSVKEKVNTVQGYLSYIDTTTKTIVISERIIAKYPPHWEPLLPKINTSINADIKTKSLDLLKLNQLSIENEVQQCGKPHFTAQTIINLLFAILFLMTFLAGSNIVESFKTFNKKYEFWDSSLAIKDESVFFSHSFTTPQKVKIENLYGLCFETNDCSKLLITWSNKSFADQLAIPDWVDDAINYKLVPIEKIDKKTTAVLSFDKIYSLIKQKVLSEDKAVNETLEQQLLSLIQQHFKNNVDSFDDIEKILPQLNKKMIFENQQLASFVNNLNILAKNKLAKQANTIFSESVTSFDRHYAFVTIDADKSFFEKYLFPTIADNTISLRYKLYKTMRGNTPTPYRTNSELDKTDYLEGLYLHDLIKNGYEVNLKNIEATMTTSLGRSESIMGRYYPNDTVTLRINASKMEVSGLDLAISVLLNTLLALLIVLILIIILIYKCNRNQKRERLRKQLYSSD